MFDFGTFDYSTFDSQADFTAPHEGAGETILMPSGGFTRKKYRELEAAWQAAEARALKLKNQPQREALEDAASFVQEVSLGDGLLGALPVEPLMEALQAATAAKPSDVIAKAAIVINIAEKLLQAMEDDDEEVLMLL